MPDGVTRTLVLLRHGQSVDNARDCFTGWLDVPLSERGRREATRAGELLRAHAPPLIALHTSLLIRARHTGELVLAALGRPELPVRRSWRLNERHYGALQGRSRAAVRAEVGDKAFDRWRRSYEHAPPPAHGDPQTPPRPDRPTTESLRDVRRRAAPYLRRVIAADLRAGRAVLVVAHGNSLRALCMELDGLSPAEVAGLTIPTGVPLRYDLDPRLRPVRRGGVYLDPVAAAAGVAEVRAQGSDPKSQLQRSNVRP